MPEIGENAPDFTLPVTGGDPVTLSELKGHSVVLFFYPRDDTSGCTRENEDFTALKDQFEALGCKVFGISKDTIESHDKFMAKKSLTIPLLSDAEGDVCERYGVWKEKKMYGKTFMGIERSTFLIAKDGTIAQVWNKVKVPDHAAAVLEAVKAI